MFTKRKNKRNMVNVSGMGKTKTKLDHLCEEGYIAKLVIWDDIRKQNNLNIYKDLHQCPVCKKVYLK